MNDAVLIAAFVRDLDPALVTGVTLVVSVVGLGIAGATGRKARRVRQWLDLLRIAVQTAGVIVVSVVSGVTSSPVLALGAGIAGLLLGVVQGGHLAVVVEDGRIMARRSMLSFALWAGGLLLMQVAAGAARTGLFEVGRSLSWFSIGTAAGALAGRAPQVQAAGATLGRAAGVVVLTFATTLGVPTSTAESVSAQPALGTGTCVPGPPGWTLEPTSVCTYADSGSDITVAVSSSGVGCGAELEEEWTSRGGQPGERVNVKNDEPQDYPDGKTWFQRHLVLTDRAVVAVVSRNYDGGIVQLFYDTADQFAAANFPACADAGGGAPPPAATSDTPAAPRTSIVTEDLDPDAVPDVVPIPDDGASITSTTAPPLTTGGSDDANREDLEKSTTEAAGLLPGASVADPITSEEAADAQIAAAITAALMGLISWAEALDRVGSALASSGRSRGDAQRVVDEVRTAFAEEGALAIDPDDPGSDIFRQPGTGELTISDGTMGAPAGHVWDPWAGRWLSPPEAQRARDLALGPMRDHEGNPLRRSAGHDTFADGSPVPPGWVWVGGGTGPRWVAPEDVDAINRGAAADADRQREMDEAWDRETAENVAAADARNERMREERLERERAGVAARQARNAAIRQRIDNIASTAANHGWPDIAERLDHIYDENGDIREGYLEDLAELTSNRLKAEAALDALPDSMVADFATNTLRDMRDSSALRLLSGIATGGASEIAYQGADLADAILADIDAAIARDEDASRFGPLRRAAEVLAENNLPISTLDAIRRGATSPTELFSSLVNDAMAAADVAGAGRRLPGGARMPGQDTIDAVSDAVGHRARRAAGDLADAVGGPGTADAMRRAGRSADDALYGAEQGMGINKRPGLADDVPDSARGTIDGRATPGLDDVGPAPSSNTDDWVRRAEPGTKIPPEQIRSTGYTPEQAAALRDVARRNGAVIGTRTTNPKSTRWIESGDGVPKPVWMKPKTISELDEVLGGPSRSMEGTVGFYEPTLPPGADGATTARFEARMQEYEKLRPTMDRLQAEGVIEVKDGVVHKVLEGPPRTTKPFAGDIDTVVMLDAKTGAVIKGERYDKVIADLEKSGVQTQHGAESNLIGDIEGITDGRLREEGLRPGEVEYHRRMNEARRGAEGLLDSLEANHVSGKETVIWSGPDGHTVGRPIEELHGWHERSRGRWASTPRHENVSGRMNTPGEEDTMDRG
ncbi:MAG: hypothetical protein U5K30_16515 [Acidimicrobiales bacterium]|nr:hypothetical protein [Acidimicrobiales bacterium]